MSTTAAPAVRSSRRQSRLASIDVLRGAAIAGMVLVNQPAVGPPFLYRQLTHAAWNGWTFADTVFPAFLFVMGASMAWSLVGTRGRAKASWARVVRRAAILFAVGLLLNAAPALFAGTDPLPSLRIMGVLQRIALAYLVAAVAVLLWSRRGQLIAIAGLLVGSWAILRLVPVPGHGSAALTPAVNLPGWLDRAVFGAAHLYQSGRAGYDPEGLFGTLPAATGVLIGFQAGTWLRAHRSRARAVLGLAGGGAALLAAGGLLAIDLPINKRMWTASYVLVMSGLAVLVLAALHAVVDGGHRWGADAALPLRVLGANPLVVYVGSELTGSAFGAMHHHVPGIVGAPFLYWVWWRWLQPPLGGRPGNLVWALAVLGAWWAVAALLWRRRWFLRV